MADVRTEIERITETVAVPVGRPVEDAGGPTAGLVAAAGLSLHLRDDTDLYGEAGYSMLWATGRDSDDPMHPESHTTMHLGGYGAVGLAIRFGN